MPQRIRPPQPEVCVSEELSSVSKSHMEALVRKVAEILDSQGVSCFRCPKARYKLYPLSEDWEEKYLCRPCEALDRRIVMEVCCGNDRRIYTFELTLSPAGGKEKVG